MQCNITNQRGIDLLVLFAWRVKLYTYLFKGLETAILLQRIGCELPELQGLTAKLLVTPLHAFPALATELYVHSIVREKGKNKTDINNVDGDRLRGFKSFRYV